MEANETQAEELLDAPTLYKKLLEPDLGSFSRVQTCSPSDFSASWCEKGPESQPILLQNEIGADPVVKINTEDALTLEKICELAGRNSEVHVFDVKQQVEGRNWTLRQWVLYWKARQQLVAARLAEGNAEDSSQNAGAAAGTEAGDADDEADSAFVQHRDADSVSGDMGGRAGIMDRSKHHLFSIVALPVASTPLDALVEPPAALQQMDLLRQVFPHRDSEPTLAHKLFVSMSPTGCFLDFNVPHSGASSWIYILQGSLRMTLIPPLPGNVSAYTSWARRRFQDRPFLASQCSDLQWTEVKAGEMLVIPGGWAYACVHPEDTIALGGRFYHAHNLSVVLQAWLVEDFLNVKPWLRYLNFRQLMWQATQHYANFLGQQAGLPAIPSMRREMFHLLTRRDDSSLSRGGVPLRLKLTRQEDSDISQRLPHRPKRTNTQLQANSAPVLPQSDLDTARVLRRYKLQLPPPSRRPESEQVGGTMFDRAQSTEPVTPRGGTEGLGETESARPRKRLRLTFGKEGTAGGGDAVPANQPAWAAQFTQARATGVPLVNPGQAGRGMDLDDADSDSIQQGVGASPGNKGRKLRRLRQSTPRHGASHGAAEVGFQEAASAEDLADSPESLATGRRRREDDSDESPSRMQGKGGIGRTDSEARLMDLDEEDDDDTGIPDGSESSGDGEEDGEVGLSARRRITLRLSTPERAAGAQGNAGPPREQDGAGPAQPMRLRIVKPQGGGAREGGAAAGQSPHPTSPSLLKLKFSRGVAQQGGTVAPVKLKNAPTSPQTLKLKIRRPESKQEDTVQQLDGAADAPAGAPQTRDMRVRAAIGSPAMLPGRAWPQRRFHDVGASGEDLGRQGRGVKRLQAALKGKTVKTGSAASLSAPQHEGDSVSQVMSLLSSVRHRLQMSAPHEATKNVGMALGNGWAAMCAQSAPVPAGTNVDEGKGTVGINAASFSSSHFSIPQVDGSHDDVSDKQSWQEKLFSTSSRTHTGSSPDAWLRLTSSSLSGAHVAPAVNFAAASQDLQGIHGLQPSLPANIINGQNLNIGIGPGQPLPRSEQEQLLSKLQQLRPTGQDGWAEAAGRAQHAFRLTQGLDSGELMSSERDRRAPRWPGAAAVEADAGWGRGANDQSQSGDMNRVGFALQGGSLPEGWNARVTGTGRRMRPVGTFVQGERELFSNSGISGITQRGRGTRHGEGEPGRGLSPQLSLADWAAESGADLGMLTSAGVIPPNTADQLRALHGQGQLSTQPVFINQNTSNRLRTSQAAGNPKLGGVGGVQGLRQQPSLQDWQQLCADGLLNEMRNSLLREMRPGASVLIPGLVSDLRSQQSGQLDASAANNPLLDLNEPPPQHTLSDGTKHRKERQKVQLQRSHSGRHAHAEPSSYDALSHINAPASTLHRIFAAGQVPLRAPFPPVQAELSAPALMPPPQVGSHDSRGKHRVGINLTSASSQSNSSMQPAYPPSLEDLQCLATVLASAASRQKQANQGGRVTGHTPGSFETYPSNAGHPLDKLKWSSPSNPKQQSISLPLGSSMQHTSLSQLSSPDMTIPAQPTLHRYQSAQHQTPPPYILDTNMVPSAAQQRSLLSSQPGLVKSPTTSSSPRGLVLDSPSPAASTCQPVLSQLPFNQNLTITQLASMPNTGGLQGLAAALAVLGRGRQAGSESQTGSGSKGHPPQQGAQTPSSEAKCGNGTVPVFLLGGGRESRKDGDDAGNNVRQEHEVMGFADGPEPMFLPPALDVGGTGFEAAVLQLALTDSSEQAAALAGANPLSKAQQVSTDGRQPSAIVLTAGEHNNMSFDMSSVARGAREGQRGLQETRVGRLPQERSERAVEAEDDNGTLAGGPVDREVVVDEGGVADTDVDADQLLTDECMESEDDMQEEDDTNKQIAVRVVKDTQDAGTVRSSPVDGGVMHTASLQVEGDAMCSEQLEEPGQEGQEVIPCRQHDGAAPLLDAHHLNHNRGHGHDAGGSRSHSEHRELQESRDQVCGEGKDKDSEVDRPTEALGESGGVVEQIAGDREEEAPLELLVSHAPGKAATADGDGANDEDVQEKQQPAGPHLDNDGVIMAAGTVVAGIEVGTCAAGTEAEAGAGVVAMKAKVGASAAMTDATPGGHVHHMEADAQASDVWTDAKAGSDTDEHRASPVGSASPAVLEEDQIQQGTAENGGGEAGAVIPSGDKGAAADGLNDEHGAAHGAETDERVNKGPDQRANEDPEEEEAVAEKVVADAGDEERPEETAGDVAQGELASAVEEEDGAGSKRAAVETEEAVAANKRAAVETEDAAAARKSDAVVKEEDAGGSQRAALKAEETVGGHKNQAAEAQEAAAGKKEAAVKTEASVLGKKRPAAWREEAAAGNKRAAVEREEAVVESKTATLETEEAVARKDRPASERVEGVERKEQAASEAEAAVAGKGAVSQHQALKQEDSTLAGELSALRGRGGSETMVEDEDQQQPMEPDDAHHATVRVLPGCTAAGGCTESYTANEAAASTRKPVAILGMGDVSGIVPVVPSEADYTDTKTLKVGTEGDGVHAASSQQVFAGARDSPPRAGREAHSVECSPMDVSPGSPRAKCRGPAACQEPCSSPPEQVRSQKSETACAALGVGKVASANVAVSAPLSHLSSTVGALEGLESYPHLQVSTGPACFSSQTATPQSPLPRSSALPIWAIPPASDAPAVSLHGTPGQVLTPMQPPHKLATDPSLPAFLQQERTPMRSQSSPDGDPIAVEQSPVAHAPAILLLTPSHTPLPAGLAKESPTQHDPTSTNPSGLQQPSPALTAALSSMPRIIDTIPPVNLSLSSGPSPISLSVSSSKPLASLQPSLLAPELRTFSFPPHLPHSHPLSTSSLPGGVRMDFDRAGSPAPMPSQPLVMQPLALHNLPKLQLDIPPSPTSPTVKGSQTGTPRQCDSTAPALSPRNTTITTTPARDKLSPLTCSTPVSAQTSHPQPLTAPTTHSPLVPPSITSAMPPSTIHTPSETPLSHSPTHRQTPLPQSTHPSLKSRRTDWPHAPLKAFGSTILTLDPEALKNQQVEAPLQPPALEQPGEQHSPRLQPDLLKTPTATHVDTHIAIARPGLSPGPLQHDQTQSRALDSSAPAVESKVPFSASDMAVSGPGETGKALKAAADERTEGSGLDGRAEGGKPPLEGKSSKATLLGSKAERRKSGEKKGAFMMPAPPPGVDLVPLGRNRDPKLGKKFFSNKPRPPRQDSFPSSSKTPNLTSSSASKPPTPSSAPTIAPPPPPRPPPLPQSQPMPAPPAHTDPSLNTLEPASLGSSQRLDAPSSQAGESSPFSVPPSHLPPAGPSSKPPGSDTAADLQKSLSLAGSRSLSVESQHTNSKTSGSAQALPGPNPPHSASYPAPAVEPTSAVTVVPDATMAAAHHATAFLSELDANVSAADVTVKPAAPLLTMGQRQGLCALEALLRDWLQDPSLLDDLPPVMRDPEQLLDQLKNAMNILGLTAPVPKPAVPAVAPLPGGQVGKGSWLEAGGGNDDDWNTQEQAAETDPASASADVAMDRVAGGRGVSRKHMSVTGAAGGTTDRLGSRRPPHNSSKKAKLLKGLGLK